MTDISDFVFYHECQQEKELQRLPVCCLCGEHIQQDYAVFLDDWYCDACLKKNRRDLDEYF